jgi:hypothetical protein
MRDSWYVILFEEVASLCHHMNVVTQPMWSEEEEPITVCLSPVPKLKCRVFSKASIKELENFSEGSVGSE